MSWKGSRKSMGCTGEGHRGWSLTSTSPWSLAFSLSLSPTYMISSKQLPLQKKKALRWQQCWLGYLEPPGESGDAPPDCLHAKKNSCHTVGPERCNTALKGEGWLDLSRNTQRHKSNCTFWKLYIMFICQIGQVQWGKPGGNWSLCLKCGAKGELLRKLWTNSKTKK